MKHHDDNIADALDVVNCAKYFDEIVAGEAYLCPTDKSAYSHRPCRFFGMYLNKRVERVAEIEAVIDVAKPSSKGMPLKAEVLWSNTGKSDRQLQKLAIEKAIRFRADELPIRVFILTNSTPTDFIKDSKVGMYESKRYFDISSLKAKDAEDLAAKLEGKVWSDFQPYRWE